jgi:hypothetical protein
MRTMATNLMLKKIKWCDLFGQWVPIVRLCRFDAKLATIVDPEKRYLLFDAQFCVKKVIQSHVPGPHEGNGRHVFPSTRIHYEVFFNPMSSRLLYNALVRSNLEYNALLWNPTEKCYILIVEKVQKAFL